MDLFLGIPRLLLKAYVTAKKTNNKGILFIIYSGCTTTAIALLVTTLGEIFFESKSLNREYAYFIGLGLFTLSIMLFTTPIVYLEIYESAKNEEIISEQEKKVAEHPNEPKFAWDLARIKLESYLTRNLSQVKSIFALSVFVMLVGFGLIIYGSIMVFQDPKNLNGSIVVAISGLIVNFIGATFLIVYKSVMEQAKEYVTVLERINAVGMSVQIIDTIKDSHAQIKEETKAELSKKLIDLYTIKNNS